MAGPAAVIEAEERFPTVAGNWHVAVTRSTEPP